MSKRTPLRIPSRVSLGEDRYTVELVGDMRHLGMIFFDEKRIHLAVRSHNRRCCIEEQEATFLHEITHGILYSMGKRLAYDEKFVTEFANLLHKALTTARY